MISFQEVTDRDLLKATLFNRADLSACGCWRWRAAKDAKGYGLMTRGNKTQRAHRISYETFKGPIPKGMVIRHTCDNPSCINPNHLMVGTQRDNVMDRELRGRRDIRGEQVGTSKLTAADIIEIRVSSLSLAKIAVKYGIDKSNAGHIRTGKSWKHIPFGNNTVKDQ